MHSCFFLRVLEEIIERTWLLVDWWPGSRQLEAPYPFPCLLFPYYQPFQGHRLKRVRCYWAHLDSICDWTQLSPLYKLLRFWLPPKTSLICKFSCLLNLPPTNLECSASFLHSPCMGASFLLYPENSQDCKPTESHLNSLAFCQNIAQKNLNYLDLL